MGQAAETFCRMGNLKCICGEKKERARRGGKWRWNSDRKVHGTKPCRRRGGGEITREDTPLDTRGKRGTGVSFLLTGG